MGDTAGDPQEIAHFAGKVLTNLTSLTDSLDTAQLGMTVSASDFGNSDGASGVSDTYQDTIDGGTATSSRFTTVLSYDIDGLYQTAFALQGTDEANANQLKPIT
ncbi:MAG: hypothetical protein ACRDUA_03930 [Micromonosporaceae bacterium]